MSPADHEAIAQRVAELLRPDLEQLVERLGDRAPDPAGLVDAEALAQLLGVTRDCVYRKAAQLGGVKLASDGGRGRWRFDPATARARLIQQGQPADPQPARRSRRPRRTRSDVELLPIKGEL